ncbi:MAG TPA: FtsX-like permease family protein [Steroidobacteraceae bacterium]|nr:FtsX-like permease family protein [Steroidobacteraceae bacterium]
MGRLRQIRIIALLSLRSLHTRIRSSWVIVAALTLVSVVLLSTLSGAEGIKLAYVDAGHEDRAMVLSAGADREYSSSIPESSLSLIRNAPGIRKARDRTPLLDAQIYTIYGPLTKRSSQKPGYTGVRGIGPKGLEMSPEIKIVDGRAYEPGTREVLVGTTARRKFTHVELGDKIKLLDGGDWTVVGHFSTASFIDGDIVMDPLIMASALKRPGFSSVLIGLVRPESFAELDRALTANPALSVTVERQSDYWLRQLASLPSTPLIVAYVVSVLLAAGASSGIMHTMQATVSSRAKEIAILRAVGFGGLPVAVSMVFEAMTFACVGAAIGTAIDWLWLDGYAYNGAYGVFRMEVTPHLLAVAVGWALVTAFLGAIAPAAQEARVAVVDALGRA